MKFVLMFLIGTIFLFDVTTGYTADVLNKKIVDDKKGFYVKGGVGVTILEDYKVSFENEVGKFHFADEINKEGFTLNAAIGKEFENGFAAELELNYQESDADQFVTKEFVYEGLKQNFKDPLFDGRTSIQTFMINGLYNLKNRTQFTPYVGAGVGIAWIDIQVNDVTSYGKTSETNLAYQALAGIETEITKDFSILTGYRYLYAGEVTLVDGVRIDTGFSFTNIGAEITREVQSHSVEVALKYSF